MRKICAFALVAFMGVATPAVAAESGLQQSSTEAAGGQDYLAYQGAGDPDSQNQKQGTDQGDFCSPDPTLCVAGGLLAAGGLAAAIILASHHHHEQVSP